MPSMLRRAFLTLAVALLCFRLGSPSSVAATAQAAPGIVRDPLLDVALPELLSRSLGIAPSPFDAQLQLASAQCRERPGSSRTDGENRGSGDRDEIEEDGLAARYCKQVRYVRHVRERLQAALHEEFLSDKEQVKRGDGASGQQAETRPLPQRIATRSASGVDLQEFFEMYAETARPVVLTAAEGDAATPVTLNDESREVLGFANDEELTQFRDKCFGPTPSSSMQATLPLKIHDAVCAPFLERFRVPMFMAHDYIRRTNVSLSDSYLPSLMHIQSQLSAQKSPDTIACPHGLHMLAMVFPGTAESNPGSMDIQVFNQRFKPLPHSTRMGRQASGDVEEVAISASSGGDFARDSEHFDDKNFLAQVMPLYYTQELPAKSFLFVPGSQFATIRSTTTTTGDHNHQRQTKTTLLRFCFVDASNFNAVKQEVAVEALVNNEVQTLLQSLQSQAFDHSMFRRPALKDSLWGNFITWPKETKLLKKSDLLNSEAGSEQLQLSRRERLKQWQDDKRWDRRVESLTLPVSLPPVVVNMTRNSATLRFQDLYDLPKHDITAFGYVIRWKNVDEEQERSVPNLTGDDSEPSDANAMTITRQQIVRSVLPTALFGDDFDGKDIEAVVLGLEAETRYTFTVQIYVDETSGLESDSSRIAQTTACSEPSGVRGVPVASDDAVEATCRTLRWLDPIDDGGKQIGLYLVNARIVENAFDALAGRQESPKTVEDEKVFTLEAKFAAPSDAGGAWKTAQVCKLVPGASYLFRVAAMNSIGVGPWSSRSDSVVIPSQLISSSSSSSSSRRAASANVPTLKGKGDPDYVPMRSFSLRELADLIAERGSEVVVATLSESSADQQQQTTHALKVVLSDVHEKIMLEPPVAAQSEASSDYLVSDNEVSFDVWSSHYSPRSFHVSSEVVRADPLDASTPLQNADQVKDRIVLVTRGAVPFVFKAHYAQLAGALGIIIADVNDTCQGRFDQRCVPGADKSRGEGFAAQDRHELWQQNRIPCVLALQDASQRLLELVAP